MSGLWSQLNIVTELGLHFFIQGEMARYIRGTMFVSINLSKFFVSHCFLPCELNVPDSWKDRPDGNFPLRVEQLKLRFIEVYEIFSNMTKLANGEYTSLRTALQHEDLKAWKSAFISDRVLLTGHSFGGATAVSDHSINVRFACLAYKTYLVAHIVESAAVWAFASANSEMCRHGPLA